MTRPPADVARLPDDPSTCPANSRTADHTESAMSGLTELARYGRGHHTRQRSLAAVKQRRLRGTPGGGRAAKARWILCVLAGFGTMFNPWRVSPEAIHCRRAANHGLQTTAFPIRTANSILNLGVWPTLATPRPPAMWVCKAVHRGGPPAPAAPKGSPFHTA